MAEMMMMVKYESANGEITLTADDVKKYLVRGGGTITDSELKLFMELCKYQKLNPFTGECYCIKFKDEFQMVVGYDTYKRRAEENPAYIGRKSGIVVIRDNAPTPKEIVHKEGTCLYPGEMLIGGWCRVTKERRNQATEVYAEVSLKEYDKGIANWRTKPGTMIEKVAVSQSLRNAFPKDYEGLYTPEEMPAIGPDAKPETPPEANAILPNKKETEPAETDPLITQEQRQVLFATAKQDFKDDAIEVLKKLMADAGYTSTVKMPYSVYDKLMNDMEEIARIQDEDVVEEPENIELTAESVE